MKILIAEDDDLTRELINTMVKGLNFETILVEDGKKAVEAAFKEKPDLILMDIRMPQMDGIEATIQIRESSNKAKEIPIVAVSAFATQADIDDALEKGIDHYLTKPVRKKDLEKTILRYIKK